MARFRKVNPRIWSDAKFRQLSERAKLLWFYLLTGPDVTSLPGVIVAGRLHLAEALSEGLPKGFLEGFDESFAEVAKKGMAKADFDSRVIWIPNAWKYNRPENPNVVRSWRDHWDNVPECPLKVVAYSTLKEFVEGLGKGYGEAFREALSNPMPNQEPEQEPEQEPVIAVPAKPVVAKKTRERDPLFDAIATIAHLDPSIKSNASHIGKVAAALRGAEVPYTPAEVLALPEALAVAGLSVPLTAGVIEKYINLSRNPNKPTVAVPPQKALPNWQKAALDKTPEQIQADTLAERERQKTEAEAKRKTIPDGFSILEQRKLLNGLGEMPE